MPVKVNVNIDSDPVNANWLRELRKQRMKNKFPKLITKDTGVMKDINGRKIPFKIRNCIEHRQSDYPGKVFVLQDILFENGKNELRLGYYIIGKRGRMKDRWAWGQFCPFLPKEDFREIIRKAKGKGIV